jgi:hypothetical protein
MPGPQLPKSCIKQASRVASPVAVRKADLRLLPAIPVKTYRTLNTKKSNSITVITDREGRIWQMDGKIQMDERFPG